ncbi:Phosphoenolpyruvate/pyruvate domain-containing protein [Wolfiporia cocos MD-104 SS10]|uniref:Phosphoenolpyruvate/pyruvate domain-containing protein n=1 Tax=Wolfiporia cocos (strain MD-104) TaxID=742152 RepID=A0A2H3JCJ5_WOLCO|nr:Phosphoenolpyruvate/pyruvate domain-containing protein [Wolfiporia cocos MD-104 SS10]
MATHRLLEAFRAPKPAFGAWITLPGALNARTAALASPHLSWLLIDCEHGMTSLQPGAAESIQAISGLGSSAPSTIVRIPATGACADGSAGWQIKYVLDAGARGVLVPMVSTAAQAKSIVAAARFPPKGIRGFGSPFTQSTGGLTASEYLASANDGVVVLIQIETVETVQNLDKILSVDGLDGVLIGPYDLSLAHNYPPPSPDPHPEVEVIIQEILRKAHAKGKKCAMYCTSGAQSNRRAQQGFDMINVTSDSGALSKALAEDLAAAAGETIGQKDFGYN